MAYLSAAITNLAIAIHGKKGTQMKPLSAFLLEWDIEGQPEKKQSPEDMLKIFTEIAMTQKSQLERKKKMDERRKNNEQKSKEKKEQRNKDKITKP